MELNNKQINDVFLNGAPTALDELKELFNRAEKAVNEKMPGKDVFFAGIDAVREKMHSAKFSVVINNKNCSKH